MCQMLKRYPLRVIAAVLLLIVGAEIYGICHTPTYSVELASAKLAYQAAMLEHQDLLRALGK